MKGASEKEFKKALHSLFVHELGHTLYLQHAPGNSTAPSPSAETHDPAEKDCVMTYSKKAERVHCGGCIAVLRGMKTLNSPTTGDKKHPFEAHPRPDPDDIEDDEDDETVEDLKEGEGGGNVEV